MQGIILIGPSGVGKSLVGSKLSRHLRIPFVDIDQEIEKTAGVRINWIFDKEGESGFRTRELAALVQVLACSKSCIIATGAGIVVTSACREEIMQNKRYFVVYLCATAQLLYRRLRYATNRPMLAKGDKYQKIADMLAERSAYYQSLCDYTVRCDGRTPYQIVTEILHNAPAFS